MEYLGTFTWYVFWCFNNNLNKNNNNNNNNEQFCLVCFHLYIIVKFIVIIIILIYSPVLSMTFSAPFIYPYFLFIIVFSLYTNIYLLEIIFLHFFNILTHYNSFPPSIQFCISFFPFFLRCDCHFGVLGDTHC
jgi:hypothetical protein